MRILILGVLTLILFTCCNKRMTNDAVFVTEEINMRPIVAIVPMIDSSKTDLNWDVSEELSDLLFTRLCKRDKFYLTSPQKVKSDLKKMDHSKDPFSTDLSWIKRVFNGSEFVVFIELIEHAERHRLGHSDSANALVTLEETSADLNISTRLRAVDLRGLKPKIVLQEMLHVTHHIPRQFTRKNFYQVSWENENFTISPLGIAHSDLVKIIANRLEEYLLRAKKT